MEVVSPKMKYFVTPTQNIVRGVVEGGKVTNAEFFVNKRNEYTTPTQLNQLMKERTNLALGKIELKEVNRPHFSDYDIPIDAGKPKQKKREDLEANKKGVKKQKITGGEVEDLEGGKKPRRKQLKAGEVDEDLEAGVRQRYRKKSIAAGEVDEDLEAGAKSRKSRKSPMKAGEIEEDIEAGKKRSRSKSVSKAPKRKSSKKAPKKRDDVIGGAIDDKKKDERISLADLFKHVSLNLATQTSDVIARGGNPSNLLKEDIKFFAKQ